MKKTITLAQILLAGCLITGTAGAENKAGSKDAAAAGVSDQATAAVQTVSKQSKQEKDANRRKEAVIKGNKIAFSFYSEAAKNKGNIFFSPYSIRTAFAMVYEGADGKTAEEIKKVFDFPDTSELLTQDIKDINKVVSVYSGKAVKKQSEDETAQKEAVTEENPLFKQANGLWAEKTYAFLPDYIKSIKKNFKAKAKNVDFVNKSEAARREINTWTAKATDNKIKNLFPDGSIDARSRMVLVNAVYFKGSWQYPFNKENTYDAEFTKNNGEVIKVPMMSFKTDKAKLDFGQDQYGKFIKLPYKGSGAGGLDMLILLPETAENFAKLEKNLSADYINGIKENMQQVPSKVWLPRFTFSWESKLNGTLASMGMPTAFTMKADLSKMDGSKKLYLQTAIHKAFIEVNEEGTEAAAATGAVVGVKSVMNMPNYFRVDKPFFFFIEDRDTGLILFMGKVEDPTKQA